MMMGNHRTLFTFTTYFARSPPPYLGDKGGGVGGGMGGEVGIRGEG